MFDVAIIGAGISGLICAQQLQQAGYRVVVVEKSRGLGGRVTTRRLQDTCADRGLSYLIANGELTTSFVELLKSQDILKLWTDTVHEFKADFGLKAVKGVPLYIAPNGMSAIARFLAKDLEIQLSRRVVSLSLLDLLRESSITRKFKVNDRGNQVEPKSKSSSAIAVTLC